MPLIRSPTCHDRVAWRSPQDGRLQRKHTRVVFPFSAFSYSSFILYCFVWCFLYDFATAYISFLFFFKSSIHSRPRSIHEFIRDLLFISFAWFLEYTYSSLVCWFVSFFHLLCFLFFILTAPFTSSLHQTVRLFLVPPTYLQQSSSSPTSRAFSFSAIQSRCSNCWSFSVNLFWNLILISGSFKVSVLINFLFSFLCSYGGNVKFSQDQPMIRVKGNFR